MVEVTKIQKKTYIYFPSLELGNMANVFYRF
jgi:hypothetical protein